MSRCAYVENVAAAIALMIEDERAAGRIFNVSESPVCGEANGCAGSASSSVGAASS